MQATTTLVAFDALSGAAATELLAPCCASRRWQVAVVAGRPHPGTTALAAASDAALAALDWNDVLEALAAHPRIGQPATGAHTEAAWSRDEQAAAAIDAGDVGSVLRAANLAYEDRFGWVFLICASGRSSEAVLDALTARLDNDPAVEQIEVREQLRQIVRLRLERTFGRIAA